jgi:hypothetical protein
MAEGSRGTVIGECVGSEVLGGAREILMRVPAIYVVPERRNDMFTMRTLREARNRCSGEDGRSDADR